MRRVARGKAIAQAKAAQLMRSARLVIVSGLSGAGKSQAFKALEDLGYFCVDNLPVSLLPTLAGLTLKSGTGISRAAVVVDVREGALLGRFPAVYRTLEKAPGIDPFLIFLDASDETLVRRFSETRRPHPLGADAIRAGGHPRGTEPAWRRCATWPMSGSTRPT